MKYLVYGDVGGHFRVFWDSLKRHANIGNDLVLPADVTVVQLGDLIHKGPESDKLVSLVDRLIVSNNSHPERGNYYQLVGNHESQYLFGHPASPFSDGVSPWFWNDVVSNESFNTMLRWWDYGAIGTHFIIPRLEDNLPFLITHAGVSKDFLKMFSGLSDEELASPNAIDHLDAMFRFLKSNNRSDIFNRPGMMLTGQVDSAAGFIWAEASNEVYETWSGAEMPFHQVHGHTAPYEWNFWKFYPTVPQYVRENISLDVNSRHSTFTHGSGNFYGIDPSYTTRALSVMTPLVVHR